MSDALNARAMLDAWRAHGDDRIDPMQYAFIDAMERRASAQNGDARRMLDARLSDLLDAYARDIDRASLSETSVKETQGPLAALVNEMTRKDAQHPSQAELLDYFRGVWSKVSAEQRLRESLARVPKNAGPLNSSHLVHRSLALMREVSPAYLEHFLSYLDALSWMEAMNAPVIASGKDAAANKKTARSKAARS